MGIYEDRYTILGLRILDERPLNSGEYYVKHEFTNSDWKKQSIKILPYFLGYDGIKIQTLHPFSSSHNLQTGNGQEPQNIWLDNPNIKIEDLY